MALRYIWGGTNHEKVAEASPMPSLVFLQHRVANGPPAIRHFGVSLVGRWWSNDVNLSGYCLLSFSAHDTYCDVWIWFLFKMPFHYSGKMNTREIIAYYAIIRKSDHQSWAQWSDISVLELPLVVMTSFLMGYWNTVLSLKTVVLECIVFAFMIVNVFWNTFG